MLHKIVRRIPRPDAEAVKLLGELGVATVTRSARPHRPDAALHAADLSFGPRSGPAITVSCHPGDNLMIHAAVEVCKPGDVMVVVTTTSESTDGMFGDLLALPARRTAWSDWSSTRAFAIPPISRP